MFKRNLWKLTLSLVIVFWAVRELIPLHDQPFGEYAAEKATDKAAEFKALIKEANDRVAADSKKTPSVFVALRQIGKERKLDLSQYFPGIKLKGSLKNIEKRNEIVLNYLLKHSKGSLQLGLDLKGGVAFTLQVADEPGTTTNAQAKKENLTKAIEIIENRINGLGVAEPIVRPVGDNRIEVQLPGVSTKDNPDVVDNVKKPARLDFRLVYPFGTPETLPADQAPPGYAPMTLEHDLPNGDTATSELYVKRIPEMTGEAIDQSFAQMDEYGRFKIILKFTSAGRKQFAEVTKEIATYSQQLAAQSRNPEARAQLAIVLDDKLYSAPGVKDEIDSPSAEITGSFTQREALDLANVLNNPLQQTLKVKEQYEVGPSLASDAIVSGTKAAVIGSVAVAVFMIICYTVGGVFAVISLAFNLLIIFGMLANLHATLSMPGIAGIVLTIGMAVDSNILIFERIREELNLGKSLKAAFHAGHDKVYSTILDANLTTLITSGLMIAFGTGPVKGFGVTLTIGIFSTMFCALVVTRLLLEYAIEGGVMKKFPMLVGAKVPSFDYMKYARPAFAVSWVIVLIGVGVTFYKGHRIYGIDFAGGDEVTLSYKQQVDSADIRKALEGAGIGEVNPLYQSALGGGEDVLKVQVPFGFGKQVPDLLAKNFPAAGFDKIGDNTIGAAIGAEIQWNALMSLGLSIIGIMLYVAFRFEFGFGVGAVVSTVHDLLMTIGIFVLTDRQFTAPMVAAILLIVGYSINDTIVVFDRIREELRLNPDTRLRDVINSAINKVLTRSLLTSITTFIAALSLYLFGGGVINDLSFTFLVGVVTGTFSSIFIASPIFYWWHKGDRKHVEQHQDVKPTYEWTGSSKASH